MIVHDGSYMPHVDKKVCSAGYMFYCRNSKKRAKGAVVERSDEADNYRAELLGGLIVQLVLRAAAQTRASPYRPASIECDNKGVVLHGNAAKRPLKEKQAQAARMAAANKMELAKRWHIDVGGDVTAYRRGVNDAPEKKNSKGVVDFWWMPYGKYKGQGFAAIFKKNPRYLAYMLEKGFLKNSRGNLQRNVVIFLRKRFTESPPYVQKSIQAAFMAANIH